MWGIKMTDVFAKLKELEKQLTTLLEDASNSGEVEEVLSRLENVVERLDDQYGDWTDSGCSDYDWNSSNC